MYHAVRADLLRRLGRLAEAAGEYARAADLAREETQRAYLRARAAAAGGLTRRARSIADHGALQDLLDGTDGPARSVLATIRAIALDVVPRPSRASGTASRCCCTATSRCSAWP